LSNIRKRYVVLNVSEFEDGSTNIYCKEWGIDITENTLGQAVKRLGNKLKQMKIEEIKRGLE